MPPIHLSPPERNLEDQRHMRWFLRGCMRICSIPALLLMSSFIGFAGLAIESGITVVQAVFMTLTIWALPAKVVLIGAISAGVALPAAALAVGLSSVRLMPMVVALLPELQGPKTRKLTLAALCHFVAVTAWVMAMEELRKIPRDMRTSYFAGIGMVLVGTNAIIVAIVYSLSTSFPPIVFAALFMLTPMYFLTSLWRSARERAGQVAMISGIALFPIFHHLAPGYDLLFTGILGGLIAFGFHRMRQIPAGAGE
ncbi:AzlC family ABC transporter permease [Brucella intermedia]|uniref:AzlC family ABC transporter permease n=2 Tax=Brucella intermedia TaxID=94625 RepID=A0AA42KLY5_9HYPH|nr:MULTISPECIES: AzlC family ABC transporter permease [Brucella]KAB2697049.1 AzlC family ABC transporter permease [Brucella intermedia]KAB2708503.1 AzlC family ABC transporter permease [Brucella intermedia]MCH6204993.1 AzlC family ABC transporter permease [Brucella ciceri]MDH0122861.1 AzlC family ABC transporter permease [Brucella intermedia GD04153]MPR60817.1 branched-chain amino acid ABC transporter permease [Brucella intermedia]